MQHHKRLPWLILALAALWLFAMEAHAEVRLPNGEYTTTVEDIKVKVLGGYVSIARSWTNGRWYVNPEWGDLKFTYDSLDGSVKGIERVGTIYERSSAGLFLYKVDQPFYIQQTASGWRWYDTKANWITYDSNGHITAYGDRNNVQVNFALDGNGHPTQVTDNFGQPVLSFQYNGDQVTGVTDRVGRQVRYQYTGANLTQVTDVLGNTSSYTYDGNGQVTSLTDQEGHTTTIVYAQSTPGNSGSPAIVAKASDASASASVASTGPTPRAYKIAKVFTVTDPEGNTTTYLYDYDRVAQRYTVTQKFPGGRTVIGVYDALGRLRQQTIGTRIVMTMTRDGDRTEMIADERGLVTTTVFDGAWNPIQVTYPDGTRVSATYDSVYSNVLSKTDEAGTQTTFQYDAKGNLTQMTEAVGFPEQRVTSYTYDQYGQRLTMTRKGATTADDATTQYTYDNFSDLTSRTDPVGNKAQYLSYDVIGNVLSVQDPRGNTWTRTYNARGWPLTQTDPLGHGATYTYDKVGNRTRSADALNNSTALAYDKDDRLITLTDALGGVTRYQYDPEGRKIKLIDPNNVTITYGYDTDGRPTTVTDGNGNVTTTVYGDNSNGLNGLVASVIYPTYTAQYKYDQRNRLTQVVQVIDQAMRYVTSMGYDGRGNRVSQTDPLGRATLNDYDAINRLTRTTDALGAVTQNTYDIRDNLIRITDANGNPTSYTYDLANRQLTETRPLGEIVRRAYDANGNLTTRTNAKSEQRQFSYDPVNRRTQEQQRAADASIQRTIGFGYDPRNLLSSYADGTTNATYAYDSKGQKTSETVNYGAFSKTIQYGYQANGKKASFTYPDNAQVTYSYDSNNQLRSIVTPQGIIGYNTYQWSVPTQVTLPGVSRTMTYDALLRTTAIKVQAIGSGTPANAQGPVLIDYRYVYNEVSDITQRTTQDGDYLYGYDALDRLTSATPPGTVQSALPLEGYSYDAVHNRTASAHQPGLWQYNAENQLLAYGQGAGQGSYQYDANGHTVRRTIGGQTQTLSYDVAERLIGIDIPSAAYYYDPMGRRLKKSVGGATTWFQYSDEGLVAEYDAIGSPMTLYGWQPNGTWGTNPQFKRDAGAYSFYHNDHLGTPQRLSDAAGNVAWSGKAEAFGKTTVDIEAVTNPLRFPGQYYDAETATQYNNFRDYDTTIGRFVQRDPIGLRGGINTFQYGDDNPLRNIDPSGTGVEIPVVAILVVIAILSQCHTFDCDKFAVDLAAGFAACDEECPDPGDDVFGYLKCLNKYRLPGRSEGDKELRYYCACAKMGGQAKCDEGWQACPKAAIHSYF